MLLGREEDPFFTFSVTMTARHDPANHLWEADGHPDVDWPPNCTVVFPSVRLLDLLTFRYSVPGPAFTGSTPTRVAELQAEKAIIMARIDTLNALQAANNQNNRAIDWVVEYYQAWGHSG